MDAIISSICCILIHGFDELDKPKESRDPLIMFLFWGLIILVFIVMLIAEIN